MNRSARLASLCASWLCGAVSLQAPAMTAAASATTATVDTPVAPVEDPPPPPETPQVKQLLEAMNHADTTGHPDLFGEFAGLRRLYSGDYRDALKYFQFGARYADKLSELSIGLMYVNGRGVKKDPAVACAWLTLAAEREYPSFVMARDRVCNSLTPGQQDRARAVHRKLLPTYGDEAAKRRMALELRVGNTQLTGSRVGYDFHVLLVPLPGHEMQRASDCTSGKVALYIGAVPVPRSGCGHYDMALSDPHTYFAARDWQWRGTVTVGPLQSTRATHTSGTGTSSTPDQVQPASAGSSHR